MYRIIISSLIALLWVSAVHMPQSMAAPADTDQAGSLVERGLTFARKGQFRKAADLFEQAVKLNPDPTILHSLARAREEMGNHALAFETFRQALELDPQYIYAQDARDRMAFLERLLKSTHARIRVTSTPGAADVRITGSESGENGRLIPPFNYWAPAGELSLEGRKDGFLDARRSITVEAGAERSVELVLRPVARKGFLVLSVSIVGARVFLDDMEVGVTPLAPMAIQAGPYSIRVEADGQDAITREVLVVADKESQIIIDFNDPNAGAQSTAKGPWGPVLLGSGAMALVGGLVMHLEALDLAKDSRAKSAQSKAHDAANEPTAAAQAQQEFFELADEVYTKQTVAYIGYGVSAALIGFGAFMLTSPTPRTASTSLESPHDPYEVSWTPVFVPSPDGLFAGTRVSF